MSDCLPYYQHIISKSLAAIINRTVANLNSTMLLNSNNAILGEHV
jgi:hypothetical protein